MNDEVENRPCLVCELSFHWANPEVIVCEGCQYDWGIDCYGNYISREGRIELEIADLDKFVQNELNNFYIQLWKGLI